MIGETRAVSAWKCALELDSSRKIRAGAEDALCDAIRRGSDLRINTEFRHNEHIDLESDNPEWVREVAEFRVTYLIEDRWTAGIMSLRQPVSLPDRFGGRASMSFFLYNQDGVQAIARPHLDEETARGTPEASIDRPMVKYHLIDSWDTDTNAPSQNFIYDFEVYRFWVRDEWREVLSHDADGRVASGSIDDLADAFSQGCEVKLAIRGLCSDLVENKDEASDHELFVHAGSCYYYTEEKLFIAGSHPVVRVKPGIPMTYKSGGWDFGWMIIRTDGLVVKRICDPYTLTFSDSRIRHPLRWFVR